MEAERPSWEKRLHVSAAALVDLKAALFRKQAEFKQEKLSHDSSTQPVRKQVSEKTASIWQNVSRARAKKDKKGPTTTSEKEKEQARTLSSEEEAELAKSRRALEAKAALYERLSRGEGLSADSDGEEGEGEGRYMVDFTRKIAEELATGARDSDINTDKEKTDEEWVEYVDSLGRSRRCLREDLSHVMELDRQLRERESGGGKGERSPSPDLLSEDMRRERERVRWEQQAELEQDEPVGPVHYQELQKGEIRTHGVGYYGFSSDETKRQEQMNLLNKLREQTAAQRDKRQRLQEKRKALLEARLAKVRQRKLKQQGDDGGGKEEGGGEDIADFDFEKKESDSKGGDGDLTAMIDAELARAREKSKREQEKEEKVKRATHVRPWDRGKVVDPIRKRKQELEDERLPEFAPPSDYLKSSQSRGTQPKRSKPNESTSDEEPASSDHGGEPANSDHGGEPISTDNQSHVEATASSTTASVSFQQTAPMYSNYPYFMPYPPPPGAPFHVFPPPPGVQYGIPPPPPGVHFPPPPPPGVNYAPPPPPGVHYAPPPPPGVHYAPPPPPGVQFSYLPHPQPESGPSMPSPWQQPSQNQT